MTPQVFLTSDGSTSLIDNEKQIFWHSQHGAITESDHVYIKNGLAEIARRRTDEIRILEVGFGTGLNALLSYRYSRQMNNYLDYFALEPFQLHSDLFNKMNYAVDEWEHHCYQKIMGWQDRVPIELEKQFRLTVSKSEFADFKAKLKFDLIYFDAFAPNTQPELWTTSVFEKLFALLSPDSILVTYCAKGAVKRGLRSAGFNIETLPGAPGKREMIRAVKG